MLKRDLKEIKDIVILGLLGTVIGAVVAVVEVIFGTGLSYATKIRNSSPMVFLPFLLVAGLLIVFCYQKWGRGSDKAMNLVFKTALGENDDIPVRVIPFAIISTWITHLFGGSAGREGVAVQVGATLSYNLGKKIKIDDAKEIFIVAGIAAGFSGLFETPLAAACFALEMITVGHLRYKALFPVFTSSMTAAFVSGLFGTEREAFALQISGSVDYASFWKLLVLGAVFGVIGGLCAVGFHETKVILGEKIKNPYIRVASVAAIVSIAMIVFERGRYSGSGANLIELAVEGGTVYWYDFILKAALTMLTLGAGFQGGEVMPLCTIGACLGAVIGPVFGIEPICCAALGYAAVFAGGTNTLLAPIFIGAEIFGFENIPFFAVVCTASFLFNSNHSIYPLQKISYKEK